MGKSPPSPHQRLNRAADRRNGLRLTRRANQAHFAIVEKIIEPAPELGSGFLFAREENSISGYRKRTG